MHSVRNAELLQDFGREIYYQCQAALLHHRQLQSFLASQNFHNLALSTTNHASLTNLEIARLHIEAIISHAANLSRIFFSPQADRAAILREMFYVHPGSPIESRKLRNAFHHYDERLDDQRKRIAAGRVQSPVFHLTFLSADGNGNFEAQWHDGQITNEEARQLIQTLRDLSVRATQLLMLTPPAVNSQPFTSIPEGRSMGIRGGSQIISHEEYLRQTGQDPDTPYPGES